MPLPPSAPREDVHVRRLEMRGYRRTDGLYDVEAHLIDTKASTIRLASGRTLPAGEPLHEMWVRLVVDEELQVHDVHACTDASPWPVCPEAAGAMKSLVGLRIGSGWSSAVRQRLGGRAGCTHLMELLAPLGSTAFQTLTQARLQRPQAVDANGRPTKIDSCWAYASDREPVRLMWPAFHDGPARGGGDGDERR